MRKIPGLLLCVAIFCSIARPQQKQVLSTPEERARFVAIVHKLEQAPLDKSLSSDREWAIKWATDVTDVHIVICPQALGDFYGKKSNYKYKPDITVQFLLSTGAYVIEHPDTANIEAAQAVAGARGALKAYDAILKSDPKATYKILDELKQKEASGQLEDYVSQKCSAK